MLWPQPATVCRIIYLCLQYCLANTVDDRDWNAKWYVKSLGLMFVLILDQHSKKLYLNLYFKLRKTLPKHKEIYKNQRYIRVTQKLYRPLRWVLLCCELQTQIIIHTQLVIIKNVGNYVIFSINVIFLTFFLLKINWGSSLVCNGPACQAINHYKSLKAKSFK